MLQPQVLKVNFVSDILTTEKTNNSKNLAGAAQSVVKGLIINGILQTVSYA